MKLGDELIFTAKMIKKKSYENYVTTTNFISEECKPKVGIYIGYRHMPIGITRYNGEDGPEFRGKGSVKVLLVVCNERQNPIMVDPSRSHLS